MNNELSLKSSIHLQRRILTESLSKPLRLIANKCKKVWGDENKINKVLTQYFNIVPYCTNLYIVNPKGIQISSNVNKSGESSEYMGLDRSNRPYMNELKPNCKFLLSSFYISLNQSRPSITALHTIVFRKELIGMVGIDIDLKDLPVSIPIYKEPTHWRQFKGDPSIRGTVFQQTRTESIWDKNSEIGFSILENLIRERGVFQTNIHFSSAQSTIWLTTDPYQYRILESETFTSIDTCLAYPSQIYPIEAIIPSEQINPILKKFKQLRYIDETLYLRSASINIFNGLISLTFSCDGTHYLAYNTFLEKEDSFWGSKE